MPEQEVSKEKQQEIDFGEVKRKKEELLSPKNYDVMMEAYGRIKKHLNELMARRPEVGYCRLYALLADSGHETKTFDLEGEDSLKKFIDDLYAELIENKVEKKPAEKKDEGAIVNKINAIRQIIYYMEDDEPKQDKLLGAIREKKAELESKYPDNYNNYRLYHILQGGGLPKECLEFDFLDHDVEKFFDELKKEL